jgi:hypothetical protein
MAFGSGKKPANQGSAAPKAPTQGVKKSGTPAPAKPGASKMLFSNKPAGTKGSGKGTK